VYKSQARALELMHSRVSNRQIFWLAWLSVAHAAGAIAFLIGAEQYRSLYRGFSLEPPAITQAIVTHRALIWWLLLVLGAIQLALFLFLVARRTPSTRHWFLLVSIFNLALVVGVFVALYIPILKLGSVV